MMAENHLQRHIQAYDHWKTSLINAIQTFQDWLDEQDLASNSENSLRIFETMEALRSDKLKIAFAAEFSRGKTELINAIFFADHKRRLLPSDAGRTTMCPTELFYDNEADEAYIRLLPIETRSDERSIADFRGEPIHWTTIKLDTRNPDQMEHALSEVMGHKTVSVNRAIELGLYSEEMFPQHKHSDRKAEQVEIPKWRHALISYPHPMLKQGLVVLDTPGLNALGNEPELTMNMLPSAQAVLFILAADTGVTRSDLDIWQYHIDGARRCRQNKGVAVVLNKIDTLWDELRGAHATQATIDRQISKTANLLGVDKRYIFPVSAQKGLLSKIRDEEELLKKSRLHVLEDYLCNEVIPQRESILRESVISDLGNMVGEKRSQLENRLQTITKHRHELENLRGKNTDVIDHLMKKTRTEQTAYNRNVESFQSSHGLLKKQAQQTMQSLSLEAMDRLLDDTRKSMSGSWTTSGLKKGMRIFFDGVQQTVDEVNDNTEQARRLILAIYKKFHTEHGLPALTPRIFSMKKFNEQFELLKEEAELFRKNPVTAMTEQGFVIKKFFINLASQARGMFFKANQEADAWFKEVLKPLVNQIKEHKKLMEKRLATLRKINESRDTLESKLSELDIELDSIRKQLATLQSITEQIYQPVPDTTDPEDPGPQAA